MSHFPGRRWRLEIEGRPGWFVPAVEGVFPAAAERGPVKVRLTKMLRSYFPPQPEDVLVLHEVPQKGIVVDHKVARGAS